MNKKIAIVEDDSFLRQQIALSLQKDYDIVQAADRETGEKLILQERPELALVDLRLPPSGKSSEGMKLLEKIRQSDPETVVIIMSADSDKKATLKAVEAGAYDFFKKPFDLTELKLIIRRALEKREIQQENARLRKELEQKYSIDSMVGQSPVMRRIYDAIRRVAASNTTVIIRGESGTGKELIARAIHFGSPRRDQPFISINCAAIPEALVETELFGHERGAFTGAVSTHTGKFETANSGTLFLDEIGSLSLAVQSKLLRVLEDRQFERIGGNKTIRSNVRLVTATNEDLEKKVSGGEFREDLYYRINVFPIHVPPLRERKEDVPHLLDHFLRIYCLENKKPFKRIDPAALQALLQYHWKGNVRELENLVQTLVLMTDEEVITIQDLPAHILGGFSAMSHAVAVPSAGFNLKKTVEQYERQIILSALEKTHGAKMKAAGLLGIDENRMKYLCRKYKL